MDDPQLDAIFGSVIDQTPVGLASDEGKRRARALARGLPPATAILLETRLSGAAGGFDLSLRIDPRDETRDIVENRHPALALSPSLATDPAWRRAAAFCAQWRHPRSLLRHMVDTVWLEFDERPEHDAGDPQPLVFVSHHKGAERSEASCRIAKAGADGGAAAFDWVAEAALPALVGAERALEIGPALLRWVDEPSTARFRHVGVMWGRPGGALRLCLTIAPAAVRGFLEGRAHPGDVGAAAEIVGRVAGADCATTVLHVDVGGEVGPDLGFELKPDREADWPLVLRRLVATGLCEEARRNALLAWIDASDPLPPVRGGHTTGASAVLADLGRAATLRRLSHVKITLRGDGSLLGKGYLGAVRIVRKPDQSASPGGKPLAMR